MPKAILLVLALVSAVLYSADAENIKISQQSTVRRNHLRGSTRKLIDIGSLETQPDNVEPAEPIDTIGEEAADEEYDVVEAEGVDQEEEEEEEEEEVDQEEEVEQVETDSFITDFLGKIIGDEEEVVAVEETKDLFGSNVGQEEEVIELIVSSAQEEGSDGSEAVENDEEKKSIIETIGDVSDGITDTITTVSDGIDKTKETIGTIKETVDEIAEAGNTAPSEWSTTQKWGVAILALVGFMAVSCVLRRLLCLR